MGFLRLLAAYKKAVPTSAIAEDTAVHVAIRELLSLYKTEQHHSTRSQYLYAELPNRGRGNPTNYTGMVWTGFRASDDPAVFGYNIPDNLFLAATLKEVPDLVRNMRDGPDLIERARLLREQILEGVKKYGTTETPNGEMYCYEVDGLGNCLEMDDANMPSLLSIPYFDPDASSYDKTLYNTTRDFILSRKNQFFYTDPIPGIGSPHTKGYHAWPMSVVVEALTNRTGMREKLGRLRDVLKESTTDADPGGVLMHESLGRNPKIVTRESFGWAEALYSELLLDSGCCKVSWDEAWFPHADKDATTTSDEHLMRMNMDELRHARTRLQQAGLENPERVPLPGETESDPVETILPPKLPSYVIHIQRAGVSSAASK